MTRSPINKCKICGKPIIRMVKVRVWNGYYLEFSQAKYCGPTCYMREYRRKNKFKRVHFEAGNQI